MLVGKKKMTQKYEYKMIVAKKNQRKKKKSKLKQEHTLVIKSIDTVNGSTLMVSTKDEKVLRVLDLVCQ